MDHAENEAIDSHSHIYLREFDADREAMLQRARDTGITRILMPAIDSETHALLFAQEKQAPGQCLAMMGLHPCSVKANYREELQVARQHLETRKFCGIGEIGLDFYWDKTYINEQYEALELQLAWALEFDLGFSLHSRNATDECIEVVSRYQNGKLRGVFHCFSGNEVQAKKITELGLYLGIGGVATFKNGGLDKILPYVNLDRMVLETDAPYLAPVPFRGKRNEPAYLEHVIAKIAEIKNIDETTVRSITTQNAKKVFNF